MASTVRLMEREDLKQVEKINGGDFPPNFLSVVYERDGKVLGWICGKVVDEQAVAQAAVSKKISVFAVKRMVEEFELYMHKSGLYYYIFGVHVKRKRWIDYLERLGIYEKYATKSMHKWYQRRLR